MPKGVDVLVENGFATIDFVDRGTHRAGLRALLDHTPSELIKKDTRGGPRVRYTVPVGNALAAGLVDVPVDALAAGDTGFAAASVKADPNANPGEFHQPIHTVDGHAFVGGRDDVNGHITGPLRPNKPVAQAVDRPTVAATTAVDLQAHVKAGSPQPSDYAPVKGREGGAPRYQATIASVVQDPAAPEATPVVAQAVVSPEPEQAAAQSYPDGEPSNDWKRAELDAYAKAVKKIDTTDLSSKAAVLKALAG